MSVSQSHGQLVDRLIAADLVTHNQVEDALRIQKLHGGQLEAILVEAGCLRAEKLEAFIVSQPGIASVDLSLYVIMDELCALVPEDFARAHQVFPIDRLGKLLTVGMAVPLDTETTAALAALTGLRVKAVYCKPEQIRRAIERYYLPEESAVLGDFQEIYGRARASSSMVSIASLLRGIDSLPSLPETVQRTKEALDDSSIAMEEVESIIERDPLVSANVLKLANSAAYNFSRRIDAVAMAIRLLGLQETYNLVLASSVLSMAEAAKGLNYKRFWQEALFAASSVPYLSAEIGHKASPALGTGSLLHDIGRVALAQASPEGYAKIGDHCAGQELIDLEEDAVGMAHPEAGFMVAERWELPDEIANLIRYHHAPERAETMQQEVCIATLASFFSEVHTNKDMFKGKNLSGVQFAMKFLNMSSERLKVVYNEVDAVFAS